MMEKQKPLHIYISADMEGVAGVVAPADVWEDTGDFQSAKHLLTLEVNAAIEAAFDAGASYVLVNDAHMHMRNIQIESLDHRAQLIRGSLKPLYMMQGIESDEFSLALFIGYHAMAGAKRGVLSHTFSGRWAELKIDGEVVGESTVNSLIASFYNCPVGLISGDDGLTEELELYLPWVEHVQVKRSISRFAAVSDSPIVARKKIYDGTKRAIGNLQSGKLELLNNSFPKQICITFYSSDRASMAALLPTFERKSSVSVSFTTSDAASLAATLLALLMLTD